MEVFFTRHKLPQGYTYGCAGEGRMLFMKGKIVPAIMLTLLLTDMLTLAFNIQPVKAGGTIYIRADGSVEGTTSIQTTDNVTYVFTANINDSIVVERDNIIIDGNGHTLQGAGNGTGIYLSGRTNVTVHNATIKAFYYGIGFGYSSSNMISGNNITANNGTGIQFYYSSSGNTVSGNNITANGSDGIGFGYSSSNMISGNNITANNEDGIGLGYSSSNMISGNNIANNGYGILFYYSSKNTVSGNNITVNNPYGILFYSSSNNTIYHNNFVDNTQQVYSDTTGYANVWDDGYPSGGNYWSDYNRSDLYSGPYQNITGSDGIGDTPYVIDENNQDKYPFTKPCPWSSHDIGITGITTSKTVVGQGFNLNINITIFNYGDNAETFNVTVYCNETAITLPNGENYTTVALTSGEATTVVIVWNTSGFAMGNCTISAVADTVLGETDTLDNTFPGGMILVTIPGDINGDTYVNAKDAVLLGVAFNSHVEQPSYDPNADINGDQWCNAKDAVILGAHFNEHW
jgi:parallel beta-helix repeat protein